MPDFITYFTKIIPLTPYLEALKIMVVEKGSDFLTKKYFWHLFILGWVYFLLGWIALKIKIKMLFKEYHLSEDYDDQRFV
jgi:ABC-2 type transport system permease protein